MPVDLDQLAFRYAHYPDVVALIEEATQAPGGCGAVGLAGRASGRRWIGARRVVVWRWRRSVTAISIVRDTQHR